MYSSDNLKSYADSNAFRFGVWKVLYLFVYAVVI